MNLPDCNDLFVKFFVPWYPEQQRNTLKSTRGDMISHGAFKGWSATAVSTLTDEAQGRVIQQLGRMLTALQKDWMRYLPVSGEVDLAWIKAFDEYYDQEHIAELIQRSDPAEDGNNYMIAAIEFGVVLGHVLLQHQPRLAWCPDMPYWESSIFDPQSGTLIPVVHWAIKKLSDYGWQDGFAEKVEACVAFLDKDSE